MHIPKFITLKKFNTTTSVKLRLVTLIGMCGLAVSILLVSSLVFAEVPTPDIPKADAKECVEETDFMRSNHMELLLHQRDETTRRGIRTKKHSLKNCIACHVVKNANNMPVSVANPKHFCRECHDYAAVKIDCFECHASKPARKKSAL